MGYGRRERGLKSAQNDPSQACGAADAFHDAPPPTRSADNKSPPPESEGDTSGTGGLDGLSSAATHRQDKKPSMASRKQKPKPNRFFCCVRPSSGSEKRHRAPRDEASPREDYEVNTRILGRRTAAFPTFPHSYPRPAWFYPKILVLKHGACLGVCCFVCRHPTEKPR